MAANSLKTPPALTKESVYSEWVEDVTIWKLYTNIEKAKQGPALYLTLTGKTRECVRELGSDVIGAETGVDQIIKKLDILYKKDTITSAYVAFKAFYEYKRSSGTSIIDFIVHFEYLYHRLKQHKMVLPEGVQAFFLLNAANISEENERLARATVENLAYEDMKTKIIKIFGDPLDDGCEKGAAPPVKQEPVFQSTHEVFWNRGYRGRGNGRGGGWRGKDKSYYNTYRGGGNRGGKSDVKVGRDGQILRCYACDSTAHFAYNCPHSLINKGKSTGKEQDGQVHITLLSSKPDVEMSNLTHEAFGMAVLDCGCTKTVCGKVWMNAYIDILSEEDKALVEVKDLNVSFRFGDGAEVKSSKIVNFPVMLGRQKVILESSVVENEIPLLLSRSAMKRADMVLDFKNDCATILGENVKLRCTTSGHYCIELTNMLIHDEIHSSEASNIVLHSTSFGQLTRKEKMKKAEKLHRQFSHATKEKLQKLVKESQDFADPEFIDVIAECCDSCTLCLKYKKAPLRPVVGLPMADNFNQVVCMDLKEVEHNVTWIFHLIDAATRYSTACLINTKRQDEIIRNIYLKWIAYFGSPNKFLSDNGGEFSNDSYREMGEKLNIEVATTAAESPFSNGIVERHNLIIYEAMMKTMDDVKCEPGVALAWAVSAKNALQNQGGYSPNQLVFGHNINIPSVLIDDLPALQPATSNEIIRKNMEAMHSARQNFVKAESSERIRRALRHNVRTYADQRYDNGDKVYYLRKNFKGWKGPAAVIGQVGQLVQLNHGGHLVKAHPCHLLKVKPDLPSSVQNAKQSKEGSGRKITVEKVDDVDDDEDDHDVIIPQHENEQEQENMDNGHDANIPQQEFDADDVANREEYEENEVLVQPTNSEHRPKPNTHIEYKLSDEAAWKSATVLSKQPKRSGKNSQWVNVCDDGEEDPKSVNWDKVEDWRSIDQVENVLVLTKVQECAQEVINAKEKELNNLQRNDVYEVVPFSGQSLVSSRWLITEKFNNEGEKKVKARLVARGFEEDSSNLTKDSPTCSKECLRLVMITAASMSWKIHSIDITSAFLQGNSIKRDVFLKPPADIREDGFVWKLKRCLYGLNDAPRSWYDKVIMELQNLNASISLYDKALFLWHAKDGTLFGIMVSHVDDFAYCGTNNFLLNVVEKFKNIFLIGAWATGSFKYTGLNVIQSDNQIAVDQNFYVPGIKPIQLERSRSSSVHEILNTDEKKKLKRLSGQMLWVSSHTRPDMAFETCVMSNPGKTPTIKLVNEANKALVKLKSTKVSLKFPNLGDPVNLSVVVYSDATHASLPDGSSQGAFIVFLKGENGKMAPISWQSKKLCRVTQSPLASETLAICDAADAGFLVSSLVKEVFNVPSVQVVCMTDNLSAKETLNSSKVVSDKRLRVDISRLREMVLKKEIVIKWIPKEEQLADSLTKRGASTAKLLETIQSSVK